MACWRPTLCRLYTLCQTWASYSRGPHPARCMFLSGPRENINHKIGLRRLPGRSRELLIFWIPVVSNIKYIVQWFLHWRRLLLSRIKFKLLLVRPSNTSQEEVFTYDLRFHFRLRYLLDLKLSIGSRCYAVAIITYIWRFLREWWCLCVI